MGSPSQEEQWRVQTEIKHIDPKDRLHICFENTNLAWMPNEKELVIKQVNRGAKGWDIAKVLRRPYKEVAVLILELSLADKLSPPEPVKQEGLGFKFGVINLKEEL